MTMFKDLASRIGRAITTDPKDLALVQSSQVLTRSRRLVDDLRDVGLVDVAGKVKKITNKARKAIYLRDRTKASSKLKALLGPVASEIRTFESPVPIPPPQEKIKMQSPRPVRISQQTPNATEDSSVSVGLVFIGLFLLSEL